MFLRLHHQLTPGPFPETLTWSDETGTTKSVLKVTGDLKQFRMTKAKKPKEPVMDNNKNVRSLQVQLMP